MNWYDFVAESNRIEGIVRAPTDKEIEMTEAFVCQSRDPTVESLSALALLFTNGRGKLRDHEDMNVRVGSYIAPKGGPQIKSSLARLLAQIRGLAIPPYDAHCRYESLHAFYDGNGRTGRAIWARHMMKLNINPLNLGFLHHWYYQTLEASRRIRLPIRDWEDRYLADNAGLIYSLKTNEPLHVELNSKTGRWQVKLWRERVVKTVPVHKLICTTFHGPRPNNKEVSHKNGVKTDNRAKNLCWETKKENLGRRVEHGTDDNGCRNSRALITDFTTLSLVRERIAAEVPYAAICAEFGIKSKSTLTRIKKGQRYARC